MMGQHTASGSLSPLPWSRKQCWEGAGLVKGPKSPRKEAFSYKHTQPALLDRPGAPSSLPVTKRQSLLRRHLVALDTMEDKSC